MNNWSITEKIYLYLSWDGEKVSIANPEHKKFWGPVQKNSESVAQPLAIDNTGSKIKVSDGKVFLDVSGKFLKITNLYEENLLDQISGATFNNGVAEGVIFGFSQYNPEKTILIFPGTSLHTKTEEEFLRKVSLSIYTKTSKYIPGNKYETESGSFWYLGTYISHRGDNPYYDKDYKTNQQKPSHVFSNFLPDSKKLSDILKSTPVIHCKDVGLYPISDCSELVLFTYKSKSMADLGGELNLDIKIEDSYEPRILSFIKSSKVEDTFGSGRYYYQGISDLLSIFDITSGPDPCGVSDGVKKMIGDIIDTNLDYILFKYFDTNSTQYKISRKDTESDQIKNVTRAFEDMFLSNPEFRCSHEYLETLLRYVFDIILVDKAKKRLSEYKSNTLSSIVFVDFQDYINNIGSLEFREPEKFRKTIDFVYVSNENRKISKYLTDCSYKDMVVDIYKEAIDTNGSNLEIFEIENVGTTKTPLLKYKFKITLKDIMNHFGVNNLSEIPKSIKNDLVALQIYELVFITRSDITPEL